MQAPKEILISQVAKGFDHVTQSVAEIQNLPDDMVPCVGSQMEFKEIIQDWIRRGRRFVYWDRGYLNRGGVTWIKRKGPEYFRWHVGCYQMQGIRPDAPHERLARLRLDIRPWRTDGRTVVIAAPSKHYAELHGVQNWVEETRKSLIGCGRRVVVRQKFSRVPLDRDLHDAHCLITHGSVAAIEAVLLGVPVIVHPSCAAAPIGRTALADLENLARPDRTEWLRSLASCQFTLDEIQSGEIWERIW